MFKVVPSSDLRNKYAEISQSLKEKHRPIIISNKGEEDLVAMSIECFEEMEAEMAFYKNIAENYADIAKGNYKSGEDMSSLLHRYIKHDNAVLVAELKAKYTPKPEKEDV